MCLVQIFNNDIFQFKACLKVYPTDFKVIEINKDGLLSNKKADLLNFSTWGLISATELPLVHYSSKKRSISHLSDASKYPADPKSLKKHEHFSTFSKNIPMNETSCKQFLGETFSSDVIEYFSKIKSVGNDKDFVLGEFPDKEKRTLIHTCIRYCYPYLSTVTDNGKIAVNLCSKFDYFSKLIGHKEAESFLRYACVECKEMPQEFYCIQGDFSKDQRRLIHRGIDNYFGRYLMAKTKAVNKSIEIKRRQVKSSPTKKSQFYKFVLYKNNLETLDAVQQLAKKLNVRPHQFAYAGTKDKKAETWQFMTVKDIDYLLLLQFENIPQRLHITDVSLVPTSLKLGDLSRNRFFLVLRNVQPVNQETSFHSSEGTSNLKLEIEKNLKSLGKNGFVNYFGPQRFGKNFIESYNVENTGSQLIQSNIPESPAIGKAILKQEFKTAVDILLLSTIENGDVSNSESNSNEVKRYLRETGDIDGSIKKFRSNKVREISLLRALKKFTSNLKDLDRKEQTELNKDFSTQAYTKALLSLPHNALAFYVHAYSSLVWNQAASYRLSQLGRNVIAGDLVETDESTEVHEVTEKDIEDATFSLRDVVLPLPGNRVRFPPNMESYYLNSLIEDDVLSDGSDRKSSFRINKLRLNCPGSYRKLIEYPENLHFSWDEVMTKLHLHSFPNETTRSKTDSNACESTPNENENNDAINLTLTFDLRPSCYATTFLRQLSNNGVQ